MGDWLIPTLIVIGIVIGSLLFVVWPVRYVLRNLFYYPFLAKKTIDYFSTMTTVEDVAKIQGASTALKDALEQEKKSGGEESAEAVQALETVREAEDYVKKSSELREKLASMLPSEYTFLKHRWESMAVVKVRYQDMADKKKFQDVVFYLDFVESQEEGTWFANQIPFVVTFEWKVKDIRVL